MKYTLPGSPRLSFLPLPPHHFFLRRKERKLLFRIHCRECSWTGNLFSPGFDTARPLVLLLTLAKHSGNYFCWFQIAFSSRVWSQQVFFACWACPFRHPKRSRGKDDGFFTFLSSCTLAFPERTFCFRAGNSRERLMAEKGVDSHGGKQSQDMLIWRILLQKPASPLVPVSSSTRLPLQVHTYCILPTLHGHAWPPDSNLQVFTFPPPTALRSVETPRPP